MDSWLQADKLPNSKRAGALHHCPISRRHHGRRGLQHVNDPSGSVDVLETDRTGDLGALADLGLTHAAGGQLPARVQEEIVAAQLPAAPDRIPVRSGHGPAAAVPAAAGWKRASAGHAWPIDSRT
jgi:hypothetical protein